MFTFGYVAIHRVAALKLIWAVNSLVSRPVLTSRMMFRRADA
jgi:hypothetical protein